MFACTQHLQRLISCMTAAGQGWIDDTTSFDLRSRQGWTLKEQATSKRLKGKVSRLTKRENEDSESLACLKVSFFTKYIYICRGAEGSLSKLPTYPPTYLPNEELHC